MLNRSILILATNKKKYGRFALNCALSIRFHNPDLKIFIGTNLQLKTKIKGVTIFHIENEIASLFIETKLYLDHFLHTDETIYIDADSLCYGNLSPIFDACIQMDVTVIGKTVPLADYWGAENVKFAQEEFKIDKSIMFNGGLYYLKRSALTTDIYTTARKISKRYDDYGFHRIHGDWKNEEDLVSIGMISHGQLPIDDKGMFITGISAFRKPRKLNVIKGIIFFDSKNNVKEYNSQLLIHFGGNNINSFPYITQRVLLKLNQIGLPIFLATSIVNLCVNIPFHFVNYFKKRILTK